MKETFLLTLACILVFLGVASYSSYQLRKSRQSFGDQVRDEVVQQVIQRFY